MTLSFHKYGDFFPGTGDIKDVGAKVAKKRFSLLSTLFEFLCFKQLFMCRFLAPFLRGRHRCRHQSWCLTARRFLGSVVLLNFSWSKRPSRFRRIWPETSHELNARCVLAFSEHACFLRTTMVSGKWVTMSQIPVVCSPRSESLSACWPSNGGMSGVRCSAFGFPFARLPYSRVIILHSDIWRGHFVISTPGRMPTVGSRVAPAPTRARRDKHRCAVHTYVADVPDEANRGLEISFQRAVSSRRKPCH